MKAMQKIIEWMKRKGSKTNGKVKCKQISKKRQIENMQKKNGREE
jgi:hypothetical protein